MDLYSYSTAVIITFYSLSISGAAIGGYPNMVLIMSAYILFFNKNMVCRSSVSAFMANTSNLIMKSTMCFLLLFDTLSSVILNDPSISSNALIASLFCSAILADLCFFTISLLQGEPSDALPNVMTLDLAQVAT